MTDGRGPDAVIDAVGLEAHGSPGTGLIQKVAGLLPDKVQGKVMLTAGVSRLSALYPAIDIVRPGGTILVIGVYGGRAAHLPTLTMLDQHIPLHMGQANDHRRAHD